VRLQLQI